MNIGIYIYKNAEVLDFSGPFEVFSTASRVSGLDSLCKVFLIAEYLNPVYARAGYQVQPHYCIDNHPDLDVLIVSGGDQREEQANDVSQQWILTQSREVNIVASVCTGAFLLAQAGVLLNHQVTTHWEDIAMLRQQFPLLEVVEEVRWVDQGKVVTSAGITAGIDMSLHIVARLFGRELASKTARQMDFVSEVA